MLFDDIDFLFNQVYNVQKEDEILDIAKHRRNYIK